MKISWFSRAYFSNREIKMPRKMVLDVNREIKMQQKNLYILSKVVVFSIFLFEIAFLSMTLLLAFPFFITFYTAPVKTKMQFLKEIRPGVNPLTCSDINTILYLSLI